MIKNNFIIPPCGITNLVFKRPSILLKEAEELDADKEAWISLEELKEVVGI